MPRNLGLWAEIPSGFSASPRLWDEIKFDSHRDFQLDAIRSVFEVFAALLNVRGSRMEASVVIRMF